ncbi:RHS repeat-associated core domain-containing protein [Shewanella sp. 5S214]|uniref:RHS repeat-associated core domain-containing protein n=1 Tax=Shewanella sp. 5S214 TaxID=3229999 RepID=UPI00352C79DB
MDVDGDGVLDLAPSQFHKSLKWYKVGFNSVSNTVSFIERNITFNINVDIVHRTRPSRWVDLNGDGLSDILTLHKVNSTDTFYTRYIIFNKGNGLFEAPLNTGIKELAFSGGNGSFAKDPTYGGSAGYVHENFIQFIDYNDDGRQDILYPNYARKQYLYECWNWTSNESCRAVDGGNAGPNAIRQFIRGGTKTFTYDNNGNRLTGDGVTLSYNDQNKPLTVDRNNVKSIFSYDANGNRYKQVKQQSGSVVSTTYYVGSFEREVTLSSTVDKTYIGDHTIKMKAHVGSLGNQSPFQHVLRDHLGSVDTLMDAKTGAVLQRRGYDVFGRPRDIAAGNNLLTSWQGVTKGYTDHEHLNEQELIHMNGRIYDFNVGRFLSVDPFLQFPENSQSANPYSYILNNPMSGTDPTGYLAETDKAEAVGGPSNDAEVEKEGAKVTGNGQKNETRRAVRDHRSASKAGTFAPSSGTFGGSTSYGNSSSFIAGYSSANKGDMTGALSLTPIGQTVDGIKSGIDALEAGYEEYQKTGDLTSAAVVAGKVGIEAYIERKLKVARLPDVTKNVDISRAKYGDAAEHIADAQKAGHPDVLTIARDGANANRKASIGGMPKVPGKQLDEYPPAMFKEGGAGSSVRAISPKNNMGAGACIGNACRSLANGEKVRIRILD